MSGYIRPVSSDPRTPLGQMAAEVRDNNVKKGWYADRMTFGDMVALLVTEIGEMVEAYRDHRLADATMPKCGVRMCQVEIGHVGHEPGKPEGVGSEMADVLIRLLDMAVRYEVDLDFEYHRKMEYNRTRPYQHGGRTIGSES